MKPILASATCLSLLAGLATAQDIMIDPSVDVNGDDLYSFVELTNLYPEMEADAFSQADSNGDGLLDLAEVTAATNAGLMPLATE